MFNQNLIKHHLPYLMSETVIELSAMFVDSITLKRRKHLKPLVLNKNTNNI